MAYDREFFLNLALRGKDAWNKWRNIPANAKVPVTFAGTDFSKDLKDTIDFSEFEFGDEANFAGCKWRGGLWRPNPKAFTPGRASFASAVFGDHATFTHAVFGDQAFFDHTTFGDRAIFIRAAFGKRANFSGATFVDEASFAGATFVDEADFTDAVFASKATFYRVVLGERASFDGAAFGKRANFSGAAFGKSARFDRTVFGDDATFLGADFGDKASFDNSFFKGRVQFTGRSIVQWRSDLDDEASMLGLDGGACEELEKRHKESWTRNDSNPDQFLTISFANARFDSEAIFSGRSFEKAADFTNSRFYYPPNFDAVTNASRIDFTSAYIGFGRPGSFHLTSDTKVVLRLRALRKDAEEKRDHDLERDLYIEERKAELGINLGQRFEDLKKAQKREWPFNVVRFLCQLLERNWLLDARALISYVLKRDWILDTWALILYVLRREWLPEAGRLISQLLWIAVMGVYWALADYGRSFIRPAVGLGLSVWLFHFGYAAILVPLMPQAGTLDATKYARVEWMVALGNAVPFVGPLTIDGEIKRFLFCPGCNAQSPAIPPEGFQVLVVGQNLVSITLVFFIGLALRNYFRIK